MFHIVTCLEDDDGDDDDDDSDDIISSLSRTCISFGILSISIISIIRILTSSD